MDKSAHVKDAIDEFRANAQDLFKKLSDAMAKRDGATKADLEALAKSAKVVADSARAAVISQSDAVKQCLTDSIASLEKARKDAEDGVKRSGQGFETALKQVLLDVRAAVAKASEAVAAKRAGNKKAAA